MTDIELARDRGKINIKARSRAAFKLHMSKNIASIGFIQNYKLNNIMAFTIL